MKGLRIFKGAIVSLACLGIIMPQPQLMAASPKPSEQPGGTAQAVKPIDLALKAGGTVSGRVVNAEGVALDGAAVTVLYQGKEIAKTVSDQDGNFAVQNLRGGNHVVIAGEGAGLYRFWAPETAPPAAKEQAVIVSCPETVRGQCYPGGFGGLDIITISTLGLGIAGVTLGAIAVSKIKDVEDKVDELRARTP
jgi:hypothetical protein